MRKPFFLPGQAQLYSLERNDTSSLVKKGYLGLVWLLIVFDFFFKVFLLNWNLYVNVTKFRIETLSFIICRAPILKLS